MRKLIKFIIVLLVISVAVYFGSGFILEKLSEQALKFLPQLVAGYGIGIRDASFGSASIVSFNSVEWKDASAKVGFRRPGTYLSDQAFILKAKKVEVTALDFSDREFLLDVEGLDVFRLDEFGNARLTDRIYGQELKVYFHLDSFTRGSFDSIFRSLFRNLISLIDEGSCSIPVEFSGAITMTVRRFFVEARIHAERKGGETVLVMNTEDLRKISQILGEDKLTESEIDLLAANPIRVPRLLEIRDKARDTAKKEHSRSYAVPEDAYRHVLWSYLLTKEYGSEFATKITDAHEVGSDNTPAESHMDYNNNAVGRRYAQFGYAESSILGRVMNDPDIIRSVQ